MSAWLIALTGLIYLWVAMEQLAQGDRWLFIVYLGYAFANIGLYKLAEK